MPSFLRCSTCIKSSIYTMDFRKEPLIILIFFSFCWSIVSGERCLLLQAVDWGCISSWLSRNSWWTIAGNRLHSCCLLSLIQIEMANWIRFARVYLSQQETYEAALEELNKSLAHRSYLVNDALSVADIAVWARLQCMFQLILQYRIEIGWCNRFPYRLSGMAGDVNIWIRW